MTTTLVISEGKWFFVVRCDDGLREGRAQARTNIEIRSEVALAKPRVA